MDTPSDTPNDAQKSKVLYIRLSQKDHEAFKSLAVKYRMTLSSYLRAALADHLRQVEAAGL